MSKSRDAFRTISEVSEALDTPAHVLRFWESKFSQIKPVKRAGGRRYYRPSDVDLLAGIKKLLHDDGMTIKGAQKLLREKGIKKIAAMGADVLAGAAQASTTEDTSTEPAIVSEGPVLDKDPAPLAPTPTSEDAVANDATKDANDITTPDAAETPGDVAITNVVPMTKKEDGPALTLDLFGKPAAASPEGPTTASEAEAEEEPAAAAEPQTPTAVDVPADPSDNDSKAPARLFHLLQTAPADRLAAQSAAIAPLLDRMRDLRSRIQTR